MTSVAEVLRQSGLTEEQIKALDSKVLTGLESVVTNASQTLEQAEVARRAQEQMYSEQIAPALDKWGSEKANLEAQVAFYRTQNEQARTGGFVPTDAPGYKPAEQPRNDGGQFVAGANAVPGSPQMIQEFENRMGNALGTLADLQWEYSRLFGQVMPDSPTKLAAEAAAQRLPLADYAAKKYDFGARKDALKAEEQKKHDDAIRREVAEAKDREYAERAANPNLRPGETSRFSTIERAVKEGTRPDPLTMSKEQRHASTRAAIQGELAEMATVQ